VEIFSLNNKEVPMSVQPIPTGYHTVTPYILVRGAPKLIEFLKKGFDAEEVAVSKLSDGTVKNAELKIGNSMVMLSEAGDHSPGHSMFYLYVKDVDAVFRKAVAAGGKVVVEPTDMFYGDRSGGIEDFAGNQWWIATRKENVSPEEVAKRAESMKC
jgi:PhnB protein